MHTNDYKTMDEARPSNTFWTRCRTRSDHEVRHVLDTFRTRFGQCHRGHVLTTIWIQIEHPFVASFCPLVQTMDTIWTRIGHNGAQSISDTMVSAPPQSCPKRVQKLVSGPSCPKTHCHYHRGHNRGQNPRLDTLRHVLNTFWTPLWSGVARSCPKRVQKFPGQNLSILQYR